MKDDTSVYFDTLASSIPDTNIFVVDKEMNVTYANGKEMEEFGFSRIHYEGRKLTDIWKESEIQLLMPLFKKALSGRRIVDDVSTGEDYYRITITPLRNKRGDVDACMSIMTNISKERNKELDLQHAKEEAESASRAKSDFMANMSHEIRTPLNSVIGFTEQLGKTTLDSEQRRFLNLIEGSSEHLLSIVNEILILMKIGSGSLLIEHIPFPVRSVFNQAVNLLKIKAKKKGLKFETFVSNEIPEVLLGDPVRFKQILINLLSNAIKFTEFGFVKCSLRATEMSGQHITIELKVKDSGIGIDKEEMDHIFDAFSQSDTSVTRKFGGSGLGLTIVKQLVELQHGNISMRSVKNRGATFKIVLPYGIGAPGDLDDEEQAYEYDSSLLSHLKILIVDDDETNRLLAKTILKSWKVHFDEAEDGEAALKLLSENKYDLILMDIHMPQLSGTEIVEKIRNNKENKNHNSRFVAVTANIIRRDVKTYEAAGMNDHLIKPYREESLFNKICKVMDINTGIKVDMQGAEGETEVENPIGHDKPYDLNDLINVAKGDIYFFNKTLRSYIDSAEKTKEVIEELNESSQAEHIGEKAHKLISSSRFLGLSEIANICMQIEDRTLKEKSQDVSGLVSRLITRLDKVVPMLKNEYIRH